MNIIDVLNIEHHVIINMLMHVSRRYIASFCTTCLKTYAMKDTVLKYKDRATKGFPRREGKYKRHKISKDVIELKNPYSRTQSTGHSLTACMSIVMQQQLSDDLVKGDVVQFSPEEWGVDSAVIYNGEMLEDMVYLSGDSDLPDHYHQLEDDVPLLYWKEDYCVFQFDLTPYKDELLHNVSFCDVDNMVYKNPWYTTFVHEHRLYTIICQCQHNDVERVKIAFIDNLIQLDTQNACLSVVDASTIEMDISIR